MLEQGDICQRGERSGSRGAARCSRARSCLVAIRNGRCDNDDATFDSFPLLSIGKWLSVMGEDNAPAGPCRSREHSYLVAFHDVCCCNDDRLVATDRSHALGNTCLYGTVSGSRGVARCSKGRSYLVALRYRCCDNDDATSESMTFSHIGILCGIYNMGAFWQPWCCSWFERAQFAWSRFATGAVTMTTRHSIASALIYWGICNGHRKS